MQRKNIMSGSNRATSVFDVVPLIIKPTRLGWYPSMYNYFGYLPDAGTSYGCFRCSAKKEHTGIVTKVDEYVPYCPQCGNPTEYVQDYNLDVRDIDTINSSSRSFSMLPKCNRCNETVLTNLDFVNNPYTSVYCTQCGNDITASINSFKTLATSNNQQREVLEMKTVAFEVLAANKVPQNPTPNSIRLHLYDENTENPYWNVEVAGIPVGRLSFNDQTRSEGFHSVFTSASYRDGIAQAINKVGLANVFLHQNGKMWKAELQEDVYQKKIRASITAELHKEHETRMAQVANKSKNYANELIKRVGLVIAGMDKNFYNKTGNPLKAALYDSLVANGVHSDTALAAIEEGFAIGGTRFFAEVLDKSVDYMNMSDEALDEIGNAISDSGIIDVPMEEEVYEDEELMDYDVDAPAPMMNDMMPSDDYSTNVDLGFPTADMNAPMASRLAKANYPFTHAGDNREQGSLKASIKNNITLGYTK